MERVIESGKGKELMATRQANMQGRIYPNATTCIAKVFTLRSKYIQESLTGFPTIPHNLCVHQATSFHHDMIFFSNILTPIFPFLSML